MLRLAPLALLSALVSCTSGQGAQSAGDSGLEPRPNPVRDFCDSNAEARIRAEHPELPPCGHRPYTYLEAKLGAHHLLAVAYDDDPCCTDVPTPGMMLGAHVYVDGESWPTTDSIVLPLPPENADEASAWLNAELMRLLVVQPSMDVHAIRAGWDAAGPALEKHAVGLEQTDSGWRLRAFAVSDEAERGIHCRYLAVWEATLEGTQVSAKRLVQYAEGSAMGQPCSGEPLPRSATVRPQ